MTVYTVLAGIILLFVVCCVVAAVEETWNQHQRDKRR